MNASDVMRQSRESALRLAEIDAELSAIRSRIFGQSDGIGTGISHTTVLDPTRKIDELIEAEERYAEESAICVRDVCAAETLVAGAQEAVLDRCVRRGMDYGSARVYTTCVCYALRMYYVEARDLAYMAEMTGFDEDTNDAMLRDALRTMDRIGIAHLKACVKMEE